MAVTIKSPQEIALMRDAGKILAEPEVTVLAELHEGEGAAAAWGCDLTYEYVKINADYRS